MTEATRMYEGARKTDAIEQALPKAWNKIIGEPHEFLVELLIEAVEDLCQHHPDKRRIEEFIIHLPSFSTQDSDAATELKNNSRQSGSVGGYDVFPASVPPAFLKYGALSVKSQYREFLPANQEGLTPQDRTYFTVDFRGYGEVKAYMSQGRLKIKDTNVWKEICTKLRIKPDNEFLVNTIKPSEYYQINKR